MTCLKKNGKRNSLPLGGGEKNFLLQGKVICFKNTM